MKIYIAGPISGILDFNKPAFMIAEELWVRRGYLVFNPAVSESSIRAQSGVISGQEAYRECLALDLKYICEEATDIYFLKGWEKSQGALAEFATAKVLGLNFHYE